MKIQSSTCINNNVEKTHHMLNMKILDQFDFPKRKKKEDKYHLETISNVNKG